MVREIYTDIFALDCDIIAHQVNCQGVMGAGIAKVIKAKYSNVFEEYLSFVGLFGHYDGDLLGRCQVVKINQNDKFSPKYVANLFGQEFYGKSNRLYTSYNALENALTELREWIDKNIEKEHVILGLPYKIGCGYGGGDWNIVLDIIKKVFSKYQKIEVIICNFEKIN